MRVLIDTTFALRGPSGTGVYLARLVDALQLVGVEVVEAQNDARRAPAGGGWRSGLNAAGDAWWTGVELPRLAREANADLIHHPLPTLCPRAPVPQAVTVHDLAFERFPECFDPLWRRWASLTHRATAGSGALPGRPRLGAPPSGPTCAGYPASDAGAPRGGTAAGHQPCSS